MNKVVYNRKKIMTLHFTNKDNILKYVSVSVLGPTLYLRPSSLRPLLSTGAVGLCVFISLWHIVIVCAHIVILLPLADKQGGVQSQEDYDALPPHVVLDGLAVHGPFRTLGGKGGHQLVVAAAAIGQDAAAGARVAHAGAGRAAANHQLGLPHAQSCHVPSAHLVRFPLDGTQ